MIGSISTFAAIPGALAGAAGGAIRTVVEPTVACGGRLLAGGLRDLSGTLQAKGYPCAAPLGSLAVLVEEKTSARHAMELGELLGGFSSKIRGTIGGALWRLAGIPGRPASAEVPPATVLPGAVKYPRVAYSGASDGDLLAQLQVENGYRYESSSYAYRYEYVQFIFNGDEVTIRRRHGCEEDDDFSTSHIDAEWRCVLPRQVIDGVLSELAGSGRVTLKDVDITENCSGRKAYTEGGKVTRNYKTDLEIILRKGKKPPIVALMNPQEIRDADDFYALQCGSPLEPRGMRIRICDNPLDR